MSQKKTVQINLLVMLDKRMDQYLDYDSIAKNKVPFFKRVFRV